MAETVLDVETLTQDDSQMLVEDAQPRKLENMLKEQGADTVGEHDRLFRLVQSRVGHRLALEHWLTT